ncbi:hypothetical protein A9976_05040 [Delftia sp. UME58]|nr:hypothetical protein [Delftia sp. UME58]
MITAMSFKRPLTVKVSHSESCCWLAMHFGQAVSFSLFRLPSLTITAIGLYILHPLSPAGLM